MSFHPAGGVRVNADVPAPPPGPGAAPPFAAPPTDRNKRGLWIGLGVGGLVLLLCCVGGAFGIGVLFIGGTEQVKREAEATVTTYLDAVQGQQWDLAHQQLCARYAARMSPSQLATQERRQPFTAYTLDEPTLAETVDVVARLTTSSGEVRRLFQLDTEGSRLAICAMQ
jgi:hypothetical protein